MAPEELINLSLEQEVAIESHTVIPAIQFETYSFPGGRPLLISQVPLYMALHMRNSNCCTIRVPSYLSREFLDDLIEKERGSQVFVDVPEFLFEHAHLFMSDGIEASISELKRLRLAKIWRGLRDMDGKALYINGLTRWEFNEVKNVITDAMRLGKRIEGNADDR